MNIRSLSYYFNILFVVCAMLFVASCGDDDDTPPTTTDGIPVADGFYIAQDGADPEATAVLNNENVEEGFGCKSRDNFRGTTVYLKAGAHNIVEVSEKEIVATIGGTAELIEEGDMDCDGNPSTYTLVTTDDSGAAFSVAAEGLYKIAYDQQNGEILLTKINKVSLIGGPFDSWGTDINVDGSVDATGGSWQITDLTIESGDWKVRFNCDWSIDRSAGDNGYVAFTNLGMNEGSISYGCGNQNTAQSGIYTIDIAWDPTDGWSISPTLQEVIVYDPTEHTMYIMGDAVDAEDADMDGTPDGWQTGATLTYVGNEGDVYTWEINGLELGAGGFKVRDNDAWFGWEQVTLAGNVSDFSAENEGDNITVNTPAAYNVTLAYNDADKTYTVTFE